MSKNGRRNSGASLISQYDNLFRCPICLKAMELTNLKSLICIKGHCFDLSKNGYVNLLTRPLKTKYDKMMFEARRTLSERGLFTPLNAEISTSIMDEVKPENDCIKVLDAGCGEGSHLSEIRGNLTQNASTDSFGVGLDISKEAIGIASREHADRAIWCVGDIANLPFANEQFDFIMNILSPSNYAEFRRVLSADGMVIKVIPGTGYLQELRTIFYGETDKAVYSNADTLDLFRRNLELVAIENVRYSFSLKSSLIDSLVRMTPLSWGTAAGDGLQKVLEMNVESVTVDLTVLCGRKR